MPIMKLSGVSIAVALLVTLFLTSFIHAGQPGLLSLNHQSWVKIAQGPSPDGKPEMHFPRALSIDCWEGSIAFKRVLLNWQTNPDGDPSIHPYTHGSMNSSDDGFNWSAPTASPNLDYMSLAKRWSDGQLVAIPFYPSWGYGHTTSFNFLVPYYTSSDQGITWVAHNDGVVSMGAQEIDSFRFHRGIIQTTDGTLLAPAYLRFYGEADHRAALMQSTDGGRTWTYRSNIAYTAGIGYSECTIVRCVDDSLLTVIRTEGQSLRYRRSTNNGQSWLANAVALPGLPANKGVDPYLYLMPDGILVLTYGNDTSTGTNYSRDCYFALSTDGNGTNWTNCTRTFLSSTSKTDLGNKSTGYTSIVPASSHRFIQFSDRAELRYYTWDPVTQANPFSLNKKIVDLVPSYYNRIDLKAKYALGAVTITTDLTETNTSFPEMRLSGAFDQSTDYRSGAFKSGTGTVTGSYTVDLQQSYVLNGIGVCLHVATPESATVQISNDGSSWTTVKTYTNAIHHALDYTSFTAQSARYVRVNQITGNARICLNELEIYTTTDTFENSAQNVGPLNYTQSNGGFWVADGVPPSSYGYQSSRSLYMYDGDTTDKTILKTTSASTSKTFEFWLKPVSFDTANGAIQWRLMSGTSTVVFRLRVLPNGTVQYRNSSLVYTTIAGASIPTGSWSRIKVVANASTGAGTLQINGGTAYAIGKEAGSGVTTMNGFMFSSGGTASTNDQAFFDDIAFY